MKTSPFEHVVCGRCSGCGQYSYCQMYGSTCFKCSGAGITLTARGTAAQAFYRGLLSKRADQLTTDDTIYCDSVFGSGWSKVLGVEPDTTLYNGAIRPDYLHVNTARLGSCVDKSTLFRVAHTAEEKKAAMMQALEYQTTLTKAGTVRKVAQKVS